MILDEDKFFLDQIVEVSTEMLRLYEQYFVTLHLCQIFVVIWFEKALKQLFEETVQENKGFTLWATLLLFIKTPI